MTREEDVAAWDAYYEECFEYVDKVIDKMMKDVEEEETEKATWCDAIMMFFEMGERPVTRKELKKLTSGERFELAKLCAAELGVSLNK